MSRVAGRRGRDALLVSPLRLVQASWDSERSLWTERERSRGAVAVWGPVCGRNKGAWWAASE